MLSNYTNYADDTTLYSKCDHASDLWQQLELASELESDLWDIVNWGKNGLVDFSARKTQMVLFGRSNSNGSIDMKMHGVCSWGKIILVLGLASCSKLDWGLCIISIYY